MRDRREHRGAPLGMLREAIVHRRHRRRQRAHLAGATLWKVRAARTGACRFGCRRQLAQRPRDGARDDPRGDRQREHRDQHRQQGCLVPAAQQRPRAGSHDAPAIPRAPRGGKVAGEFLAQERGLAIGQDDHAIGRRPEQRGQPRLKRRQARLHAAGMWRRGARRQGQTPPIVAEQIAEPTWPRHRRAGAIGAAPLTVDPLGDIVEPSRHRHRRRAAVGDGEQDRGGGEHRAHDQGDDRDDDRATPISRGGHVSVARHRQ